jgi:hypothetical protein
VSLYWKLLVHAEFITKYSQKQSRDLAHPKSSPPRRLGRSFMIMDSISIWSLVSGFISTDRLPKSSRMGLRFAGKSTDELR